MLRITKLTDYAIVALSHMAGQQGGPWTSRGVADATGLPQPSVSKILKSLAKAGIVRSARGVQGGYRLAREPGTICVADIIDAVEGPISLTECTTQHPDGCEYSGACALESTWARINHAVRRALADISLEDIAMPAAPALIQLGRGPRPSS
jgi:FeS assembly SUF system regulator